jgi:hypothetical protein
LAGRLCPWGERATACSGPWLSSRWRSVEKGIPALFRNHIDVVKNPVNSAKNVQADGLPECLARDLIWLCVIFYIHIAGYNYDKNTDNDLKELQGRIKHQATISELDPVSQQVPDSAPNVDKNSMAETIGQPETISNPWPIP